MQSLSVFLDITKVPDFHWQKCWCPLNSRGESHDLYIFESSLGRYNCAKFHHCRICVTDFRVAHHRWAVPKRPIPKRANIRSRYRFNIYYMSLNPLQLSVAFHIETNNLICIANQIKGFCMKRNIELKGLIISCCRFV